jgi:hypothetical protein
MKVVAKQFLTMCLAIGLLFAPAIQAQQQEGNIICGPTCGGGGGTGGDGYHAIPKPPATLSQSTFQIAQQKMVTIQQQAKAGHLKGTDVAAAATATQAVFANMDEAGYTPKLEAWIKANSDLFTTQNPTDAELKVGFAALGGTGVTETYAQFVQRITGAPLDVRQAFITAVQTNGLAYFHKGLVAAMNATANSVELFRDHRYIQVNKEAPSWWAVGAEYFAIVGISMAVIAGAPFVVIAIGVAGAAAGAVDLFQSGGGGDGGGCCIVRQS